MDSDFKLNYITKLDAISDEDKEVIKNIVSAIVLEITTVLIDETITKQLKKSFEVKKTTSRSKIPLVSFDYVPDKKSVIAGILNNIQLIITKDEEENWKVYLNNQFSI